MLERRGEGTGDAGLGSRHLPQRPACGTVQPADRGGGRWLVADIGRLDGHPGIQGAQLRHGEGGDLAVGLDLPGKRAIAPDEPELDARPADAPGIEAATRSGVERPDELDPKPRVGGGPRRQRDDEPDGLRRRHPVVGALARDGHETDDEDEEHGEHDDRDGERRERCEPAGDPPDIDDHGRTGSTVSGSMGFAPCQSSKCRCGPVVCPVSPTVPSSWPAATWSPLPTASAGSRWP